MIYPELELSKLEALELSHSTFTINPVIGEGVGADKVYGLIYPPKWIVGFEKSVNQPFAEDGMLGIPIRSGFVTLAANHRGYWRVDRK